MRTHSSFLRLAVFLLSAATCLAAEWREKSPRQPVASVSAEDGTWRIVVSFLPVTSFDEGKNRLENERISRSIAEWGLLRELGAKPDLMLETSGMVRTEFFVEADRVRSVYTVPTNGVRLVNRPSEPIGFPEPETAAAPAKPEWPAAVADVSFDDPDVENFLCRYPFLMETGGAKIVRLADGMALVISIGMTDAAKSPLARRTVAEQKARAALVTAANGVRVYTETRLVEATTVIATNGVESSAVEFSESTERICSESSGWLPGLPVLGTWTLKDEGLFCLAIGRLLPKEETARLLSIPESTPETTTP